MSGLFDAPMPTRAELEAGRPSRYRGNALPGDRFRHLAEAMITRRIELELAERAASTPVEPAQLGAPGP